MKKCDFCVHSYLKDGKLMCPFAICVLTRHELKEILKQIKE